MQSGWLDQHFRRKPEQAADRQDLPEATAEVRDVSRRDFMRGSLAAGAAAGLAAGSLLATEQSAQARPLGPTADPSGVRQTPIGAPWWPSRWGAEDEAGASNWITPAKILEAARLIRTGQTYELGRVYESEMPLFGARTFSLRIPGTPTGGPLGDNKLVYHDEFLATEIGQVGTQFDGLGHIGCATGSDGDLAEQRYYNGFSGAELANPYGLPKLGIEKVKPFFTRAVLVDVAGYKGRMLDRGEEISAADVLGALGRVGIDEGSISPGDAVFFNTGWGSLWKQDNARFNSGEPGIGMEVARWLVDKQVSIVGADTWATEVVPNPDSSVAFVVHQELITKNGIFNHENLDFSGVIGAGAYEFVYVMLPLRIKGATGSPGRPIAMT